MGSRHEEEGKDEAGVSYDPAILHVNEDFLGQNSERRHRDRNVQRWKGGSTLAKGRLRGVMCISNTV